MLSGKRAIILGLIFLAAISTGRAGVVLDAPDAPEWQVSEWINGNPGRLAGLRGRVVLIQLFQLWCPVSNEFSIPLFNRWYTMYGGRDDVVVVAIHSVFEGHDQQTPERLRQFVRERNIRYPVGIDTYSADDRIVPMTFKSFHAIGSPHVFIVDKEGKIRFSHFGQFEPLPAEAFIERLLKETKSQGPRSSRGRR
jgi:thiol-disulfide isomerase/thioredoxin